MQELVKVNGIVIKAEPIGDFDRRVVILTAERGKISAFAKGARKPNSRFVAGTNPFVFACFHLYEGKSSYSINEIEVKNYFEELRMDYYGAFYGMYFLEMADYYTRENNDELDMLKLLFQSLRALMHDKFDNLLVRSIYEIKALVINGEFPGVDTRKQYNNATLYAIDFIVKSSIEKLYTFTVTEEVINELVQIATYARQLIINNNFKSLEILDGFVM